MQEDKKGFILWCFKENFSLILNSYNLQNFIVP